MAERYMRIHDGSVHRYKDREFTILHCEDGPAVIKHHGERQWWVDGNLMKIDDGDLIHYNKEGKFHREGAPAIIWADGVAEWWDNGKLVKKEGAATIQDIEKSNWWADVKLDEPVRD